MKRSVLMAGWVMTQPTLAQQTTGEEVVLKAEPKARTIEFHVRSGGCTKKANFGLEALSLKPLTVRLVRLRPDYCEARPPSGQKIEFAYSEVGAPAVLSEEETKNVVVVNLVASP